MNKKFIITGAPGTGKSSIINELIKRGYPCTKEISRELISKQLNSKGEPPWKDQFSFENEIINYNMTTHTASIVNADQTFIVYEYIGHTSYKVQFLDYTSGIVSFQFTQL